MENLIKRKKENPMEKLRAKYAIGILFLILLVLIGTDIYKNTAEKPTPETEKSMSYYDALIEQSDAEILVIDSSDLTNEMLENRNGKIIIEKVIGEVLDDEGNGKILNNNNYYISYKNTKDIKPGSIVLSYMIYDPDTNYFDDIKDRYDYVIAQ